MKKIFIAVICMCAFPTLYAQDILRVMSMNMDAGRDNTLDSIASFINKYHPDVAALQEVDMFTERSKEVQSSTDFLGVIGSKTSMFYAFGKALPIGASGCFGNAVLSKEPYSKTENVLLPLLANTEQRGMLVTHFVINDHRICLASVHLSYENEDIVVAQLNYIKRYMESLDDDIIMICGDYNLNKPHKVLSVMEGWKDALPDKENTFSSAKDFYKRMKLDYMLYKSILPVKVVHTTIDCDPSVTDHCSCIVEMEIPNISIPE